MSLCYLALALFLFQICTRIYTPFLFFFFLNDPLNNFYVFVKTSGLSHISVYSLPLSCPAGGINAHYVSLLTWQWLCLIPVCMVGLSLVIHHTYFNYFSFDNGEYQVNAKAATVSKANHVARICLIHYLSCWNVYLLFSEWYLIGVIGRFSHMTQFRRDEILQNGRVIPLLSDERRACYSLFDCEECAPSDSEISYGRPRLRSIDWISVFHHT